MARSCRPPCTEEEEPTHIQPPSYYNTFIKANNSTTLKKRKSKENPKKESLFSIFRLLGEMKERDQPPQEPKHQLEFPPCSIIWLDQ
jgi:hypothetical protein